MESGKLHTGWEDCKILSKELLALKLELKSDQICAENGWKPEVGVSVFSGWISG